MYTLIDDENWDVKEIAKATGLSRSGLYNALGGYSEINTRHLGAFHAYTDALPTPEQIRKAVVHVSWDGEIATGIREAGGQPGSLNPEDLDPDAMALLSALAGVRSVLRTSTDRRRDQAVAATAEPLLLDAALRLAARTGLSHNREKQAGSADIHVVLGDGEQPAASGFWTETGPVLAAELPTDWIVTVAESGRGILEDRFVLAIKSRDAEGRPIDVIALDLMIHGRRVSDTEPEANSWQYLSRPARVTWGDGEPTLTFAR